ncbi:MAG: GNAT family N-acetyltransferase [Acidimicrobiia bacterium]|nr:GNAT family N-acetyltransferase [Acidimicrobiia bacterium]
MAESVNVRYEIDLSVLGPERADRDATVRRLDASDSDALAQLMLDAYVGTIDYQGETLAEAIDEVDDWLGGSPMLAHSYGAVVGGRLVSAVLVMTLDDVPFVAYVMTDPDHKETGLGRAVVEAALSSLRESSHERVVLYITKGNAASERLFATVGAQPTD